MSEDCKKECESKGTNEGYVIITVIAVVVAIVMVWAMSRMSDRLDDSERRNNITFMEGYNDGYVKNKDHFMYTKKACVRILNDQKRWNPHVVETVKLFIKNADLNIEHVTNTVVNYEVKK